MSIGQRIATKRKEYNLSQEALGDLVGVSRQAIYKWESDQSLPEIEKLIALSQIFDVSVGWLLGVEDHEKTTSDTTSGSSEQALSKKHLITRHWPYIFLLLLCLFLLVRTEQLKNQYRKLEYTLQNSIDRVTGNLNTQLGSLTSQVENILKAQNSLTADYRAELDHWDPTTNTATFRLFAIPKTYVEGMTATFLADSNGQLTELAGTFHAADQSFSGSLTCELTDDISLSVAFRQGDTTQTQLLDQFQYLYSGSFPEIYLHGEALWSTPVDPNMLATMRDGICWYIQDEEDTGHPDVHITTVEVGLFCDRKLITWGTPCQQPENYTGFDGSEHFIDFGELSFPVKEGEIYCIAARITDNYGRSCMISDLSFEYKNNAELEIATDDSPYFSTVTDWGF